MAALLQTPDEFLTLEQARAFVPGQLTYVAIWRWARYGLKVAGSDNRICLRHRRFGQVIYTTRQWIAEFGQALADADRAHFDTTGNLFRAKPPRVRLNSTNSERANYTLAEAGIID